MLSQLILTLTILLFANFNIIHSQSHTNWGYVDGGVENKHLANDWGEFDPKCDGDSQSPIDIETRGTVYSSKLKPIKIRTTGDSSNREEWKLANTGKSAKLEPLSQNFETTLPDGQQYRLLQMHFHWLGSEHLVDGKRYAGELHLVHQSLTDSNKLAVLGFLFDLSDRDNEDFEQITDKLVDVIPFKAETKIDTFRLLSLIPSKIDRYYNYPGSLTTPGCDEIVDWFVVESPTFKISQRQLIDFQSLEDEVGYPILTNSRPVQHLNDRGVGRSFKSLRNIPYVSENEKPSYNRESEYRSRDESEYRNRDESEYRRRGESEYRRRGESEYRRRGESEFRFRPTHYYDDNYDYFESDSYYRRDYRPRYNSREYYRG